MPQISGVVCHGDGSPASGHRVSAMAAGALGGMIGPTTTDRRGYFTLSWSSSTTMLAKVYVDGAAKLIDVPAGRNITISV